MRFIRAVRIRLIVSMILLLSLAGCGGQNTVEQVKGYVTDMVSNETYGVSASNPLAVEEGMKILRSGGNAVDAAIAISYMLGVVEPYASGIGGGGGMLISYKDGQKKFIDYRETAPNFKNGQSSSSAVPGFVTGMDLIHQKYGSLSMEKLLRPSIHYAEKGFKVDGGLMRRLEAAQYRMNTDESNIFYPDGEAIQEGETLIQKDLADTLQMIETEGPAGFYNSSITQDIYNVAHIPVEDMQNYKAQELEPVHGTYKGFDVYTAPAPFGGITFLQILKFSEKENVYQKIGNTADYIGEFGRFTGVVYQDRLEHIADPKFTKVDSDLLVSDQYISELDTKMKKGQNGLLPNDVEEHESTTHFVVIDKEGTVVSATNTLSNFFGSGKLTNGFFLNNQLDNFGNTPNQFEPGKRSRTFTAPSILEKKGEVVMGIGSPGGNRIPQMLVQALDKYVNGKTDFQEIVDEARFAFEKDIVYTEFPLNPKINQEISSKGYKAVYKDAPMFYGGVQALIKNEKDYTITGASDKRRNGIWKAH
ncbi:gamma-glutamyltranspeptidase/glutathione hydrolase [Bacillus sp. RC242]|uniref:gamma-glutamyltransferase family protein n=1 Tax=Bacillus sp. RC242 TaxID=3156286 RepID=UPI003833041E